MHMSKIPAENKQVRTIRNDEMTTEDVCHQTEFYRLVNASIYCIISDSGCDSDWLGETD